MSTVQREPAKRIFAREFNASTHTFKESDEERAPVYALAPTGERINRVYVTGTLTETEDIGSDGEYWRGRVVDSTGTFYVYAGQYQPEAMGALQQANPPLYVGIVGKPRTYETDEGETNVSVQPETIIPITEDTRRRWVAETAERTLDRIDDLRAGETRDAIMARDVYGEDIQPYLEAVIKALEGLEAEGELEATP